MTIEIQKPSIKGRFTTNYLFPLWLFNNYFHLKQCLVSRLFLLYIPAMSLPYDEDGKMAEANKLLDEAKTFLYMGKVREARKVWDQEPMRDEDREYHETFWKKIYEDCYQQSYKTTSLWKRVLGRLTRK